MTEAQAADMFINLLVNKLCSASLTTCHTDFAQLMSYTQSYHWRGHDRAAACYR
jgi:hypothetical protein